MPRIDNIIKTIEVLPSISESERADLLQQLLVVKKDQQKKDFMLKRLLKDKSIVVNILESTIADLGLQRMELEEANLQLLAQKRDLSEKNRIIKEKSERLKYNLQQLENSYRELEQFSYVTSHDLKGPLRTITCFAQLLQKHYSGDLNSKAKESIDFIVTGVLHMNEVIEGILEYSKVSNISDTLKEVDINEVVATVKANLKTDIEDHRVTIYTEDLPIVKGNKIALVQLFQNLIHNAINYRSAADPVIRITADYREEAEKWEFKVSDNGSGISKAHHEKIFKLFQRVGAPGKSGLGIGLAVCQKVVKIHGGTINYVSNPEGGTTFVFTLGAMEMVEV